MKQKNEKKAQKLVKILGININSTPKDEVLARVEDFVSHNRKFYIVTPNPELILASTKNKKLKEALNGATLSIPDGVGVGFASKFLYGKDLNVIPGRKLFLNLIELARQKGWKVFLLGGLDQEAAIASRKLQKTNPKLQIQYDRGPKLNQNANPVTEVDRRLQKDAVDKINKFTPDLLFVAFGNPKQEIWIHKNLPKLKIHGAMAVGGTFRYIAGLSKLPPKWMESLGLEWLWRLITEPKRAVRIFNAAAIFPWKVFLYKIRH